MTTVQTLFEAAKANDRRELEQLLEGDPSLVDAEDERGVTLLMTAIYNGASEVVDLLRQTGARIDVIAASALGDVHRLRHCLDNEPGAGSSYSSDGFTPLHLAGFFGHPEAVQALLDRGADLHAWSANDLRNQPLHASIAGRRDPEVIRLLLDGGAEVNAVAHGGYTPLHLAASRGDHALMAQLIARGAIGGRTDDGRVPSEIAMAYGHPEAAAWLLEQGAG